MVVHEWLVYDRARGCSLSLAMSVVSGLILECSIISVYHITGLQQSSHSFGVFTLSSELPFYFSL